MIERVVTLGSKVTQKSSTLSSITKEFQKIVPICLYMVCKHWSSHVRRSYRKLGVFAVQKTRKLGMCYVKCNTFERLWEAIMTSTMIPLLYTHIKLREYAFRCAKMWYFAHFLHTHAQCAYPTMAHCWCHNSLHCLSRSMMRRNSFEQLTNQR